MSSRIELDGQGALATNVPAAGAPVAPVAIAFDNDDQFGGPTLPNDHPAWLKDAVSLSQRARVLVTKLKPIVLHVIAAWEHRVRTIVVGGRRVSVDASGSYRIE